jgi:hypothetical protein
MNTKSIFFRAGCDFSTLRVYIQVLGGGKDCRFGGSCAFPLPGLIHQLLLIQQHSSKLSQNKPILFMSKSFDLTRSAQKPAGVLSVWRIFAFPADTIQYKS